MGEVVRLPPGAARAPESLGSNARQQTARRAKSVGLSESRLNQVQLQQCAARVGDTVRAPRRGPASLAMTPFQSRDVEARMAAFERRMAALEQERTRSATEEERHNWAKYLAELGAQQREGRITEFQARCVLDVWQRAIETTPNVMYPTAGMTEDGDLYLAWNLPDRTMVVEVHPNEISWFYEDVTVGHQDGSEEGAQQLPTRFYSQLRSFARP